jgi:uncharacterized protein (DUF433 family)
LVYFALREIMQTRIEINPAVHFGKPCVTGTRIPVKDILELVKEGVQFETIIRDYYPELTIEDIHACIQYAIDVLKAEDLRISSQ